MLLEMKRRQRQVRQAVPADMAPGFSSLPLISASGLLFVFNKQLGNVWGYCLCDSLATERRKKITNQNVQRSDERVRIKHTDLHSGWFTVHMNARILPRDS